MWCLFDNLVQEVQATSVHIPVKLSILQASVDDRKALFHELICIGWCGKVESTRCTNAGLDVVLPVSEHAKMKCELWRGSRRTHNNQPPTP
jgi:hypothetical protein